jgi:hypothetical protein
MRRGRRCGRRPRQDQASPSRLSGIPAKLAAELLTVESYAGILERTIAWREMSPTDRRRWLRNQSNRPTLNRYIVVRRGVPRNS